VTFSRRIFAFVIAVALVASSTCAAATAARAPDHSASDATVILFSRDIDGTSCGNAYFVGDGTLLVTARSVVFPRRNAGLHQGEAFVTALSPYLGIAAEVQVLAQDQESDLVLLRGPFGTHPSLQLADENELVSAGKLGIVAYTDDLVAIAGGHPRLVRSPPRTHPATLDVNAVLVRRGETRGLNVTAPPASGWAGAPLFLADSNRVAGCYLRTQGDASAGAAAAGGAIRRLIEQGGAAAALTTTPPATSRPDRANDATVEYLRGIAASAAGDANESLAHLQAFVTLRPTSSVGYRDLAGQLRALGRLKEAQDAYAKALELEPALVSARVLYGQLLHERILPRAAEEHLTYAWQHGGGSTAAVVPLCNLLREQGRDAECLPMLEQAVQRRPYDAHLWNYLGQAKQSGHDVSGAAIAFARSADLMPENATVRLRAADQFESAGERSRAEAQYRLLVVQHPDSAAAHFHFARSIARDSSRQPEAMTHAERALNLAAEAPGSPPRAAIQSLITAIRAGRTADASDFKL
jgi:tetratricopeptide (TPR) repeat protein